MTVTNNLTSDRATYSQEYISSMNLFWLGFSLYTIGFVLAITGSFNVFLFIVVQFIGLALLLFFAARLINFRISTVYLRIVYTLYCAWLFTVAARGLSVDIEFLEETFSNPYGGILIYFAPLVLLIPRTLFFYKKLVDVIVVLGCVFLVSVVVFHDLLLSFDPSSEEGSQLYLIEFFGKTLSISSGFILLTYTYHSKVKILLSLFVVIVTNLFAISAGRRGLSFSFSMILLCYALITVYISKEKFWTISFFLIVLLSMFVYAKNDLQNNKSSIFSSLSQRLTDDTRSEVTWYYYADMQTKDWIIGRGMSGLVAAPYRDVNADYVKGKPGYRNGIENDYLNIILKGGLISLCLLLLIAIPATIKGLFFSKNLLSKAAGIWILLWIIDLYPTTVTAFNLRYLLVWISIGICYSRKIRNIPEKEMKKYFITA